MQFTQNTPFKSMLAKEAKEEETSELNEFNEVMES